MPKTCRECGDDSGKYPYCRNCARRLGLLGNRKQWSSLTAKAERDARILRARLDDTDWRG